MNIYNTYSRAVEPIVPLEPGTIRMYSCGPTVYRYIHIGNLRTFMMADWLRRALEYRGLRVTHVKNITDVGHMRVELLDQGEDKLISQARKEGKTSAEIATFYTDAFMEDERKVNIQPAHHFPRATEHVPEMIAIVADLLAKDVAYEVEGTVFYDVTRFPRYGALSGNRMQQALRELQADQDPRKRHPEDFPLWKPAEPGREMAWDSPWGRGFPGWHIECSAMAIRYLGPHFDIHTGGVDNLFPHHEDEIAQSEAHTGQRFANAWVHAQHLLSDGQKMAKSTGNAYTLSEIEARGYEALALRYLYTQAHYRSRMDFTFRALRVAQRSLGRLRLAVLALAAEGGVPTAEDAAPIDAARERFLAAVEDDLNLPQAMAVVWSLLRGRQASSAAARLALLLDLDRILGFDLAGWLAQATAWEREQAATRDQAEVLLRTALGVAAPSEVRALAAERAAARVGGRYPEADALRTSIAERGFEVRDGRDAALLVPIDPDRDLWTVSRSADVPDCQDQPDRYAFSVNLLARNSRDDLARCIDSILRHRGGRCIELLIVDNGSTDDTLGYLRTLAREGLRDASGERIDVRVLFADHDMGFAAGRNATMRASTGARVILLDTSIEIAGDIWTPIEAALDDPEVGFVGPYALVTGDLKEFAETNGPDADAVEGYLIAFRRSLRPEIGPAEEKFRFYRLLDIYLSFFVKAAGYRVVRSAQVAERIVKHAHREWYSLTEFEQANKSKKNYDLFRDRWHHGESLLVANAAEGNLMRGHDHPLHLEATHTHAPGELPPLGVAHVHEHRHWPDHSHSHPHVHDHNSARSPVAAGASAEGS